jgi:hypothetical protein
MRRIGVYVCMGLARTDPPGAEHGRVTTTDGARVTVLLTSGEVRVYEVDGERSPAGWQGRSVLGWRSPRSRLSVLPVERVA